MTALREQRPKYMRAAETLGRRSGLDASVVLDRYRQAVRNSSYPGPECLEPHEIERYIGGDELAGERTAHVEGCDPCAAALEAARPSPHRRDDLLRAVRQLATAPVIEEESVSAGEKAGEPKEVLAVAVA